MKKIYLIALLVSMSTLLKAQETDTSALKVSLDEIVVSATGFSSPKREVAQIVQIIGSKQIAWQNAPTSADVLQNTGNILVQRSQGGGGSPIIRGFEANKVLIHIDGVRLNNAIFRGGHLQNVLRIDNSMLEKLEILYGPASVRYGSDALGGVMHFTTKNPEIGTTGGNAFIRYSSATAEKTAHADVNLGGKSFASLSSFTFSDFGDLVQGSVRKKAYPDFGKRLVYAGREGNRDIALRNPDPDRQVGTAYSQYDFLQKFRYQPDQFVSHTLNLQYSNSSDVPRYDRLSEVSSSLVPRFAEWYYGPEERLLLSYALNDNRPERFFNSTSVIAAYQIARESRHSRRFGNDARKSQFEDVRVASIEMSGVKNIRRHELVFGAEAYLNQVGSSAYFTNVVSGTKSPSDTRYPRNGSTMNSFALYGQDKIKLSEQWIANAGLRFNYITLDADFGEDAFFPFPYRSASQRNHALSGALGLVFLPNDRTRAALSLSTGVRAPNVDDLGKVFETVPGMLIVPNPDIRPEHTANAELNLQQWIGKSVKWQAAGFYTHITNAIVLEPFQFNGQDSVRYDGIMSRVMASQNNRRAFITGFNTGLDVLITPAWTLRSTLTYTRGRILEDSGNRPLDHIPPLFGQISLRYGAPKFQAEAWWVFNGKKDIKDYLLNAEDNERYATPDGMPAWNTLNLRIGYSLHPRLDLQLACENLFDTNYRIFASGVSGPGRNFRITLRSNLYAGNKSSVNQ